MSQQPKDARSLPHFIAQMIGEMNVRIEKLERRTEYQGKAIKKLVSQNSSLRARLTRSEKNPNVRPVKPSVPARRPSKAPEETPIDDYEGMPDFTASLRELRKSH